MLPNGRTSSDSRHVRLYHWLMRTEAWRDLDTVARCAYLELDARYNGSNNGRIPFSCREMARALRCSKATALRALRRLQDHGFVIQKRAASFDCKVRHAPEWLLTEFRSDLDGSLASKEFVHWRQKSAVSPEGPNAAPGETARVAS
jgi:hypothetical protein